MRRNLKIGVVAMALALTATACSGDDGDPDSDAGSGSGDLTPVSLQLQWVAQAQFAGYYAAVDRGFYEDEGLDVTIEEGGPDIVPRDVLAAGDVDYAISWVPKVLGSIEQGAGITDVAQIFEAQCDHADLLQGQGHRVARRPRGQERRQLGLRQRVGAVRRHAGRRRRPQGHQPRPAGLRHERLPGRRHRRRAGDDLQRVRPGPGVGQPGHRRALPARGPQRHRLERRRHGDAPGTPSGPPPSVLTTRRTPIRRSPSSRPPSRAGPTSATTPRPAPRPSPRQARSSAPATSCG
ncbi:ABC transporter substrate-binding protein [Nocardioides sp. B-3]|nr:ABC transporter substrate-binding protein [Nocardioides sp. B-3]UUZ61441.1 ABC transporter substrate-binding protein [Nocardioides sp. B-3]